MPVCPVAHGLTLRTCEKATYKSRRAPFTCSPGAGGLQRELQQGTEEQTLLAKQSAYPTGRSLECYKLESMRCW